MKWLIGFAIAVAAPAAAQPRSAGSTAEPAISNWDLQVPERLEVSAETVATLPIAIAVGSGQTISKDADPIVDLAPEPGIAIKRRRLGRADAVDPDSDTLRFAVPVGAPRIGDYSIKLRARFWLCGTKLCRPIDARRTVAVTVIRATAGNERRPD